MSASTRAAELATTVIERTEALARIPAPPGQEARRATTVAGWWRADGWRRVRIDAAGNVWAKVRDGAGPATLLCAHLDTVFGEDVAHGVRGEGGRLVGPSVGDDSVAVAALSAAGTLLSGPATPRSSETGAMPVWILATVGEEGSGNLRGIRHALRDAPAPIQAVVAVEGNYLGRVSAMAVGSFRLRVTLRGPGGHAWEAAGAPSAVHELGRLTAALSELEREGSPARCSVNVGRVGGGEAINARAREAWLEVDVRADDPEALGRLESATERALELSSQAGFEVEVQELGRRAAGRLEPSHPLVVAAVQALAGAGFEAQLVATSTDANAAHELAIPAIAVGVTTGGGEHTLSEWIDIEPIAGGLAVLADTMIRFEEALR